MQPYHVLGSGAGVISLTALALALDSWVRSEDAYPQRLWQSYRAWYRELTNYLLERRPVTHFALIHAALILTALPLALLVTSEPLLLMLILIAAIVGPPTFLSRRVEQRREILMQQIDPTLQFIANALQVTPNLEEALTLVAQHMRAPMSEEIRQVAAAYLLGQSLDDALQSMAQRCNDPFVTAMIVALVIGRRTGGNISSTLRRIAFSTREAVRVEMELRSKTKGQRNQFYLIVLLFPLGLVGLKNALPATWLILTTTFSGRAALFVAMAIVGVAIAWARKILSTKNL